MPKPSEQQQVSIDSYVLSAINGITGILNTLGNTIRALESENADLKKQIADRPAKK